MSRTKKRRFQVLRNVVLGTLVFLMLAMLIGGLAERVIVFMLTGIIDGTTYVVPVWGMYCIYSGIIVFLLFTYYIDRELENHHLKQLTSTK